MVKAWKEFYFNDDGNPANAGRMKESSFRDRVVNCAEEFAKFTAIMAPVLDDLTNRCSKRKEKEEEGGVLLTQAQKEARKTVSDSRKG